MRLLNIFEWYREHDIDHLPTPGSRCRTSTDSTPTTSIHPDGTVYCTQLRASQHTASEVDPRLPPAGRLGLPARSRGAGRGHGRPTETTLVNSSGQVGGQLAQAAADGGSSWIMSLADPGQRAFIISDSRFSAGAHPADARRALPRLAPDAQHPRAGTSPLERPDPADLRAAARVDRTISTASSPSPARSGRTSLPASARRATSTSSPTRWNSRPVPIPCPPRERQRFAIVSRFERQKHLEDAVRAFALVLKEEPDAIARHLRRRQPARWRSNERSPSWACRTR